MLFLGHIIKAVALQFREKNSQTQSQFTQIWNPHMCHVGLELDSTYYLTTLKAVQGIRGASWCKLEVRETAPNRRMYLPESMEFSELHFWYLTGPFNQNWSRSFKNTLKQRSQPNMFLHIWSIWIIWSDPDSKDISGDVSKYVLMWISSCKLANSTSMYRTRWSNMAMENPEKWRPWW